MEFLIVLAFFGYIFYLRNYADLRTASEKEEAALADGIALYNSNKLDEALAYFNRRIAEKPKLPIAYLYRALIFKANGHQEESERDLKTAVSLDDAVYRIQLEVGKMYLEKGDFGNALIAFNKVENLADTLNPEVYHLRGHTYLKLNQPDAAQQDFNLGKDIRAAGQPETAFQSTSKSEFVDRKFIASFLMVIFTSAMVVSVIHHAKSVHIPYLVAVFSAIIIGFAEPQKGWFLAIAQCVLIFAGYMSFVETPGNKGQQELENFGLYGSMILTFAASFLGAFLKRALNMK
ncbi:M48 family metallopeptidase [Dyadobacter sp. CY323]|uniref:tetratricopeptide repeat protein n=1 Tax=Dyadobacter sp. CY323 TaxID=2907302 RepID=UPI001F2B4CF8|nr:hypothetical protein [Dyadobacter sp. CY323]MCE6990017.1 hypothetical protein [Dyadobacter sp. CY323]